MLATFLQLEGRQFNDYKEMSKKDILEEQEIKNEQEAIQDEENQEVEIEAVKEEPTPE